LDVRRGTTNIMRRISPDKTDRLSQRRVGVAASKAGRGVALGCKNLAEAVTRKKIERMQII
jgi:hypothetical protein